MAIVRQLFLQLWVMHVSDLNFVSQIGRTFLCQGRAKKDTAVTARFELKLYFQFEIGKFSFMSDSTGIAAFSSSIDQRSVSDLPIERSAIDAFPAAQVLAIKK